MLENNSACLRAGWGNGVESPRSADNGARLPDFGRHHGRRAGGDDPSRPLIEALSLAKPLRGFDSFPIVARVAQRNDEIVKEKIHAKILILLVSAVGLEPTTL
jgi:hypothetical protein